ncbi:myb-like protein V [Papaver somniferum]|uniref:myb-like protein V n=1 Tax=Papaver somniferum TaxID=3469 RepID=UPI000E6F96CE|nr:myb-like protein V [Papaver somniferum]
MVTSSSMDYDYYYSSSSPEEDSKNFVAKARAKTDNVKEMKHNMPLSDRKVTRDELLKRKVEDETLADYRQRRDRFQRRREIERLVEANLEAEHKEEEYWDMMYSDPDERPDFVNGSNNDSEEETDEDSSKDNNDDKSSNSDKSDDSDESDASDN